MASSTSRPAWPEPRRTAALWAGLLVGPVAWLALLEAQYVMSYVSCETREKWFLHAATAVAVLIVALSGWAAWRSGPAQDAQARSEPDTAITREVRARWMSLVGVATSIWFILVILAMEVPIVVLETCQ
jgi:hypothetical protein